MPSIATRKGDDGSTSLLYGQRVTKDHPQIEAVGCFDELNAAIGFAKATCTDAARREELARLQRDLVSLMGEVACAEEDAARYETSNFKKIDDTAISWIDEAIAKIEAGTVKFDGWATPGANLHAAALEMARTIARRAERRLTGLPDHGRNVRPLARRFVNRLSDFLWLLARQAEG